VASTDLQSVVNLVATEYKGKPYQALEAMIEGGTVCFNKEHKGKTYSFEINAEALPPNGVRLCVLGEPHGIMGFMRGFAEYFGVYPNGTIVTGEETWF